MARAGVSWRQREGLHPARGAGRDGVRGCDVALQFVCGAQVGLGPGRGRRGDHCDFRRVQGPAGPRAGQAGIRPDGKHDHDDRGRGGKLDFIGRPDLGSPGPNDAHRLPVCLVAPDAAHRGHPVPGGVRGHPPEAADDSGRFFALSLEHPRRGNPQGHVFPGAPGDDEGQGPRDCGRGGNAGCRTSRRPELDSGPTRIRFGHRRCQSYEAHAHARAEPDFHRHRRPLRHEGGPEHALRGDLELWDSCAAVDQRKSHPSRATAGSSPAGAHAAVAGSGGGNVERCAGRGQRRARAFLRDQLPDAALYLDWACRLYKPGRPGA